MPITLNRHSDNLLSSAKKLSDVFNDIRELSEERIYSIPSDEFLAMETQEIAESILDDYKIELLSLQDAHVSAPEEQGIDFIVRQTIPFTGDAVLLRSKANRSLDPPPSGHIKKENEDEQTIEVLLNIPGALLDKPIDIKTEAENALKNNTKNIHNIASWGNSEAEMHNKALPDYITPIIEIRRRRLENAKTNAS